MHLQSVWYLAVVSFLIGRVSEKRSVYFTKITASVQYPEVHRGIMILPDDQGGIKSMLP